MAAGPSFRLFGIPVRIDPTFLVIAGVFGLGGGGLTFVLTWIAVVTVSVLVHELGHAVMFRVYGHRPSIVLQGMGGLTWASGPLTETRNIVVSLAGPLTGLVLLGLPALWIDQAGSSLSPTWDLVVRELVFVNIAWSIVNLLPVLPLDGGNVAASVLRRVMGDAGDRAARQVSVAVAGAAGLFALASGFPFGALFAAFFVGTNLSALRQEAHEPPPDPLVHGYQALARKDLAAARAAADGVLDADPPAELAASAVELKAWADFCSSGAPAAAATLVDLPPGATPNGFLAGSLALVAGRQDEAVADFADGFARRRFGPWSVIVAEALAGSDLADRMADRLFVSENGAESVAHFQAHLHAAGRFQEAAGLGERLFDADPGPEHPEMVAYNVACSWARAGRTDDALDWLERATERGFADRTLLARDPDLEALRRTARFRDVCQRLVGRRTYRFW